ncbi:MAG: hypothetical protein AB8G16_18035 [Gammaproteobacteria bacterium]
MSSLRRAILLPFLVLTCVVSAHAATVDLGSGVWVDDASGSIIAGVPGQRLIALDQADGVLRWAYRGVARPVLMTANEVIAFENAGRTGRLRLVSLKKDSGERVARNTTRLPRGVLASADLDLSSRFEMRPHPKFPTSRLVWVFSPAATDASGTRALPQSGVLNIDPATARAGALDESPPTHRVRSARLTIPFAGTTEPAFFSADRQHVIVSRRARDATGFEWDLYDRDARRLGRVKALVAYAPFVVRDDLLIALHASAAGWRAKENGAPVLRVLDWRRGGLRWEHHFATGAAAKK